MKSLIILLLVVLFKVFGNVSLSEGMNEIGQVKLSKLVDPSAIFALGLQTLANPWLFWQCCS